MEIVSARVRSIGAVKKLKTPRSRTSAAHRLARPHEIIETFFERKKIRGAVYLREDINCGSRLRVPSIVTEYSATTLIPEGCQARVDAWGNMIIDVAQTPHPAPL